MRAQAADDAKFRFGPSSFEKENDRKRKEMLSSTAFTTEQQRGLTMFLRRTPRNMFLNLLAAAAQVRGRASVRARERAGARARGRASVRARERAGARACGR